MRPDRMLVDDESRDALRAVDVELTHRRLGLYGSIFEPFHDDETPRLFATSRWDLLALIVCSEVERARVHLVEKALRERDWTIGGSL